MKFLLLVFFSFFMFSGNASADSDKCSKPITMLFGPFFSDAFVRQFFETILENAAAKTGCDVQYRISETYANYHQKILSNEFELVLSPSIHLPYVEKLDYVHLVAGFGPLDFVLLANRKKGIDSIADLKRRRIMLNGDISTIAVIWRKVAKDYRIEDLVDITYRGNLDQLLMRTLRGQADATITFRGFYDRLPENLKTTLIELHSVPMQHPGSVVVSKTVPKEQVELLRSSFVAHELWSDVRPKKDVVADAYVDRKIKQILQIK